MEVSQCFFPLRPIPQNLTPFILLSLPTSLCYRYTETKATSWASKVGTSNPSSPVQHPYTEGVPAPAHIAAAQQGPRPRKVKATSAQKPASPAPTGTFEDRNSFFLASKRMEMSHPKFLISSLILGLFSHQFPPMNPSAADPNLSSILCCLPLRLASFCSSLMIHY